MPEGDRPEGPVRMRCSAARDVTVTFGGLTALSEVSLSVARTGCTA